MNKNKPRFQETPSTSLADELYELGQKAKKKYREPLYGEFLITQSLNYRTGRFQAEYLDVLDYLEQEGNGELTDEDLDEILMNVDFTNQPSH